jgi:hypothetical protein
MANQETIVQNEIRLAISSPSVRMFRNNTGSLKDENGRRVSFGLCAGSSDLIGWSTREITSDMVGKKVAVFTAIEIKTAKGRVSESQQNFINAVRNFGGIAGVARSVDDAKKMLESDL